MLNFNFKFSFLHLARFMLMTMIVLLATSCNTLKDVKPLDMPWQQVAIIVAAVYEILVRYLKTNWKYWSIIEVIFKIVNFLIPNRTEDLEKAGTKHVFNFLSKKKS